MMARFCPNCGNELPDNAAMCVKCGKMLNEASNTTNKNSSKKKGLPTWAIVLIVVGCVILIPLIIIIILGVVGYNIIKDVEPNHINNGSIFSEGRTLEGTINDTLQNDDIRITLNDTLMYSSIGSGYFVNTPADGNEYLVFFFDVQNKDDEGESISYLDFDGYVDNYETNPVILLNDVDGTKSLSATLAPGMKTTGYVAFEVSTDWKEFEIRYDENMFDDDDDTFIFKVVNPDA